MTPEETNVIRKFWLNKDLSVLATHARGTRPSEDFLEFIYCTLDRSSVNVKESLKSRGERMVALVIDLCDQPKLTKENPKSVFYIVANLVEKSPSTVYRQYYKYYKEPATEMAIAAYREFKRDPSKALPVYKPIMLEIEEMVEAVNAEAQ